MTGALPYVWITTRRNALRRFLRDLLRLKRLPTTLLRLLVIGFLVFGLVRASSYADVSAASAPSLLTAYLSVLLVLSALGGLTERGIAFRPSEVDFLFPGPFRPRSLVLYHVTGLYLPTWLAAALPTALFGMRAPSPLLGFFGALLCQLTAQHLRLIAAILAVEVGERTWTRLRTPIRVFSLAATIVLLALIASVLAQMGGMRAALASLASSPVTRWLLYPAVAAGDLAASRDLSAAIPPLLGAAAAAAVTLLALLSLQVNFLEASIGASERLAAVRERVRRGRGLSGLSAPKKPAAGARLPALALFRGAGAVAWKNRVTARRSGRRIYFSVVLTLVIFFPTFLAGRQDEATALVAAAALPFLLASYFRFDFRGEGEQIEALKVLPVSATGLAAAEVAVPAGVALSFQALLLVALVALGRVRPAWAPLALLGYVPVTAGIFAIANLAHFLGSKGSGVALVLHTLFLGGEVVFLGATGWLLRKAGLGWGVVLPVLAAVQAAIVLGVIVLLGLAFTAHDVAREGG